MPTATRTHVDAFDAYDPSDHPEYPKKNSEVCSAAFIWPQSELIKMSGIFWLDLHINSQTRMQTSAFARCSWEYAQWYCIIEGQWKSVLT